MSKSSLIPIHVLLYVKVVIIIKNIFPINNDEINFVKFIGKYQYLSSKDIQYFFNGTYYPKRITRLIKNSILRRYKKCLVLDKNGYEYMKILKINVNKLRYQQNYAERIKFISHIAAIYNKDTNINFIPSFKIKDKTIFTESSRRYIGVLNIKGTNYLLYHISSKQTERYINSVMFDIQKESKYKNVIVLVDNIERIKLNNFAFGLNSVIICCDDDESIERLKYLQSINWFNISLLIKEKIYLAESNLCDYVTDKGEYITVFYLVDTEKINRINRFNYNNPKKLMRVVCSNSLKKILEKEININKFEIVNIDDLIEKEKRTYG